jgi:hypothetical protein
MLWLYQMGIMTLGFYLKMIYCLCARSRANRVGFYTISYIQVHILSMGLSNVRKLACPTSGESYHILDLYVRDGLWIV